MTKKSKKQTSKEMLKFTKDLNGHLTEMIEMLEHGIKFQQAFSAGHEKDVHAEFVELHSWAEDLNILAGMACVLARALDRNASALKMPKSKKGKK